MISSRRCASASQVLAVQAERWIPWFSRRSNCPPEFATAPCTASEKSIASAGNEQVCQQLLSSDEFGVLGCSGTRSFQESDALAACTQ